MRIIYLSILVMLFISCDKEHFLYEKSQSVSNWQYGDIKKFEVPVSDTSYIYNLILDVKHDFDYPRQNTYVQIHTKFPKGDTIKGQLSLELFDPNGLPYGSCDKGVCVTSIGLQDSVYFNQIGDYYFGFEQYSRDENLKGIQELTLKLQKTDILVTSGQKE